MRTSNSRGCGFGGVDEGLMRLNGLADWFLGGFLGFCSGLVRYDRLSHGDRIMNVLIYYLLSISFILS